MIKACFSSYLKELENVIAHVIIDELRIEAPEISVVDVFEDERGGFALQVVEQQSAINITRAFKTSLLSYLAVADDIK